MSLVGFQALNLAERVKMRETGRNRRGERQRKQDKTQIKQLVT